MKNLLLLLVLVPSLSFAQSKKQKKAQEKADKETLSNLKTHIQYLASDKLEGRRAGTAGEGLAMDYIATEFKKAGLEPKGTEGYIQAFEINDGKKFDSTTTLTVNGKALALKKDFFPLAFSANATSQGAASLSLREKGSPWFWDVADLLDDNKDNPHFDVIKAIYKEAKNVAKRGGTALIVFNSSENTDNVMFEKFDTSATVNIPVMYVTEQGVKTYMPDATDIYDVAANVKLYSTSRTAHNVVGYIDNNAAATVVIGAHFDHLGYGEDDNSLDGKGQIHNGADDNASGTAAVIELAKHLKKTSAKNNNYLFIAFSGEELGLFGSKYWLDHQTTTAPINYMINFDMVGRYNNEKKLTVGGYGTSPVWATIVNATTKSIDVKYDSTGAGPSDHASFYYKNIPVLFFFTSLHSDYHKATDDADKINYEGEVQVINFAEDVIKAADVQGKLAFSKTRDPQMQMVSLPVTLGVMPDYSYSGKGLRIEGVSDGKTAQKAGLQAGDVLLQLGEYKFADIQSYMQALQHFKKGEATKLVVQRNNEEKVFDVVFQ